MREKDSFHIIPGVENLSNLPKITDLISVGPGISLNHQAEEGSYQASAAS